MAAQEGSKDIMNEDMLRRINITIEGVNNLENLEHIVRNEGRYERIQFILQVK